MRDPVDWPTRDLLAHRAAATPERTGLVSAGADEWTYRELDAAAGAGAARIAAATDGHGEGSGGGGVVARPAGTRGPRVGLLADTSAAFFVAVHAVHRAGGTVVPLNAEVADGALAARADRAGLDLVVCDRDTEAAATAIDTTVLSLDSPGRDSVGCFPTEPAEAGSVPAAEWERDRTAVVLFTSGTTGDPKGVRLTMGNLVASATASALRLGVTPADRWLCCLPTYHMGGLAPLFRTTLYGTTLAVGESGTSAIADALERSVTGVSLVPTQLRRLLETDWSPPEELRTVLLGGAPAGGELTERALDCGVPVCPTYGLTETASQVATARPETVRTHPESVGQPLLFTGVTLVDETGEPVGRGPGEIVVDGPTVTPGYLSDGRTGAAFGTHGLHTGDRGRRDEDGRLYVLGRVDDAITTGGENVYPAAVAAALTEHERIDAAAVVGLPDEEWGERVGALVVPDGELSVADVHAHARDRLPGFKRPKTVALAAALPRTPSGTVDRAAIRERLEERP